MKKVSKIRQKILHIESKIIHSNIEKFIPSKIRKYIVTHNARWGYMNYSIYGFKCPFCKSYIKMARDCKKCGAVHIYNWWYRR